MSPRNPFRYLKPVPPSQFLGRWSLVKKMAQDLLLDDGDSHACIGGRRFGKTSLLMALHHELSASQASQGEQVVLPILFNFKKYNFVSEATFFASLLQEVRRRVDVHAHSVPKDSCPVKVILDDVWLDGLLTGMPPSLPLHRFQEALTYIMAQLYQEGGPTRLVVLLDEVDDCLRYPWKQALFNQLRSAISDSDFNDSVRLVLAGSRHFLDEVTDRGSPLWNVLKLHYLTAFDKATTLGLCQQATGLSETTQEAVWQQSGGHPFLAQYLLHHLFVAGISQANERAVPQLVKQFLYEQQTDLEGWARGIDVTALQLYRQFIKQSDWIDELDIIRATDPQKIPVKRCLVALCYHGFIVHDGEWSRYRRCSELLHHWYIQEGERLIKTLSAEQQSVNEILSFQECAELVQYLLAIASIANRTSRATVIEQLPAGIKTKIAYSEVDKIHVFNIVKTCLEYPNGMEELRDRLQFFEGGSIPMQQFKECLKRHLPRVKQ